MVVRSPGAVRTAPHESRAAGPAGGGGPGGMVPVFSAGHLGDDHLRVGRALCPDLRRDRRADSVLTLGATLLRRERCRGPDAAAVLPGDVPTRDARVSPRGQLLSVLPPAPGALLCELPPYLRRGTAPTAARLDETPERPSVTVMRV